MRVWGGTTRAATRSIMGAGREKGKREDAGKRRKPHKGSEDAGMESVARRVRTVFLDLWPLSEVNMQKQKQFNTKDK
jgi:hypothetical protein